MSKYLRGILIFISWLLLILLTAFISGRVYELFLGSPSGLLLYNSDLLVYLTGIMASHVFVTTIFCLIFIKKHYSRYIFSILFSLPIFLFDFVAGDPIKLFLDIINLLIAMAIGHLIILFIQKSRNKTSK